MTTKIEALRMAAIVEVQEMQKLGLASVNGSPVESIYNGDHDEFLLPDSGLTLTESVDCILDVCGR